MRHPHTPHHVPWPAANDRLSGPDDGRRGRRHHPDRPDLPDDGSRGSRRGSVRRRFDGPDAPPFGPGPFGPPLDAPSGERRLRGPRGERGRARGRAQRGDVRTATLLLLAEGPMHGYSLMQAMAERTQGAWRPSPGAVYPTISQLEDEGLVTTLAEGGRKLVTLTEAGQAHVAGQRTSWVDPFAGLTAQESDGPDLRPLVEGVHVAARQIAHHGTPAQTASAATVLADARRALYLILAEADPAPAAAASPAGGAEQPAGDGQSPGA